MILKSTPFSNFQKEWSVISNVWKRRRSTPGPSHTLCLLCANMPGRAQEEISRREGRLLRVQPKMLWQMEDNVGHGEEAFQHAVRMWQEKVWARDEDLQASGRAFKREKENQEGERPECSKATNVVLLPVHERNQVGLIRNAGINDLAKTLCCRDAVKAEQPGWKIGDISKEIARRWLFLYYKLCCKSLSCSSQTYLTEAHLISV